MESDPRQQEHEAPPDGRRRGIPWGLLILWIVLACAGAGIFAFMTRAPSLWGGGSGVMEYMLPLPLTWGMLHWPGLLVFSVLLAVAYNAPGRWLGLMRLTCVGVLLGAVVALTLIEALRGFPLLVFVCVDAFTALVVSTLIAMPPNTPRHLWSPRVRTAVVLGPALLVVAALVLGPYLQPRYKFSMSDTVDLGGGRDMVRFWVYTRRGAGRPEDECPHLADFADQRRDQYPPRSGERHRAVLLFADRNSIGRTQAGNAWVTYEWWPDGREYCSADADFRP